MKKFFFILPLFSLMFIGCDNQTTKNAQNKTMDSLNEHGKKAIDELNEKGKKAIDDLSEQGRKLLSPDASNPEADRVVSQRVYDALSNDANFANELNTIQISTQDGVVTLKGTISSSDKNDRLVDKIKSINGVKKVDNQLKAAQKGDGASNTYKNSPSSPSDSNANNSWSDNHNQ